MKIKVIYLHWKVNSGLKYNVIEILLGHSPYFRLYWIAQLASRKDVHTQT